MLLAEDDYPLHQTALPLAHVMDGHPNAYDRFWFNGYDEEFYFAVALGLYPNRGVIDGAFSVVQGERQYSVFASEALHGARDSSRSDSYRDHRADARESRRRRRDRPRTPM